ncbi:MAG: serine/threonine-protein kinase [Gemmatimonadales bacterium]
MPTLQTQLQEILGTSYRIDRELGGGGMSRVFVATDTELDRKVVIKVLPPELSAGINTDRFRREIQLAARLQHPHIVPLYAAGAKDGLLYYTMPFIAGENLRTRLNKSGELPVQDATKVLREVADALSYAHSEGVVHRDIKPENILISGNHALVTDFGVSKALSNATAEAPGDAPSLTSLGVALGTPAYMAPEQAAADPMVDARADIYALGVVGYELLTGRTPFAGLNQQQTLAAHITTAPAPISQQRPQLPPALAAVIMRAIEKRPADRWQSALEMHDALEPYAMSSGATTPSTAIVPRSFEWTTADRRRRRHPRHHRHRFRREHCRISPLRSGARGGKYATDYQRAWNGDHSEYFSRRTICGVRPTLGRPQQPLRQTNRGRASNNGR